MSKDVGADPDDEPITPGETVYDEDGQVLDTGQRVHHRPGFEVKIGGGGSASGDDAETIPDREFGEGYLMWRCSECGEMGDLGAGCRTRVRSVWCARGVDLRGRRGLTAVQLPGNGPDEEVCKYPDRVAQRPARCWSPCLADIGWKYPANPREVSGTPRRCTGTRNAELLYQYRDVTVNYYLVLICSPTSDRPPWSRYCPLLFPMRSSFSRRPYRRFRTRASRSKGWLRRARPA